MKDNFEFPILNLHDKCMMEVGEKRKIRIYRLQRPIAMTGLGLVRHVFVRG